VRPDQNIAHPTSVHRAIISYRTFLENITIIHNVFTEEPPTDAGFLSLPNLMTTPHIGGNPKEAVESMGRSAIDRLVTFFKILNISS